MRVPRLHAITDDARLAQEGFVADAAAVLEAGGSELALHLRGRETTAARMYELATTLLPIARRAGALLLVNDRVDVALVAGADGVQLREDSLDARTARALLGEAALIGVSRHATTVRESDGADFVVFGAVFETASHPNRAAAGIDALRSARCARPLIAIGGVTPERTAEVVRAGAHGVAASSGIWTGGADAVRRYLDALPRTDTEGRG